MWFFTIEMRTVNLDFVVVKSLKRSSAHDILFPALRIEYVTEARHAVV